VTVTSAPAPILYGTSGTPTQTFNALPAVTEWATLSVAGGGGDVETDAAIDTVMNTIAASSITTPIPTQAGSGTNANAYWRSSDLKLGTQPSGNKMTLLMAKLYNASGGSVDSMSVSYTFGLASVTPAEAIKGHRVYWSATGATNSWTAVGDFLLAAPGTTTVVFNLTSLANGTTYYYVVSAVTGTGETPNSIELSATPSGVSVGNSTVLNSLPSLWADAVSCSTVTVTLNNASAVPLVGKTVELVSSRPSDDTISGSPGTTDANGVVVFTVKSPAAGSSDLTVTDTTDSLPITTWTEPFVASPTPLTTYLPSATILQTWDFEDSTYQGWTPNRRTYTTPAGVQLGSKVPLLADGGAMVGMMSSPALPAAMTWVDSGVEMRFNTPNVAIPTFELEFLTWVGSGGSGFAVHSPGGTSMETKEANPGANSSWAPLNSSALVGPHTLTLLRQADGTFKTYLDGTLINTMTATTAPASAPVHIGIGENEINGNAYIPIGTVVSKVTVFNLTEVASGYAAWASVNGMSANANEDTNHDGVQNGIAYFMNAIGLATLPGLDASNRVTWTNGGNIPSSDYGTQFVVQTSTDLQEWTDVASDDANLSNTAGSVSYALAPGQGTVFCRLMVTPN